MSTVHLVRHGQASWGSDDYDRLSPLGLEQAAVVGHAWADSAFRPVAAVSGSMRRHRQTAQRALDAAGLDLDVAVDERWNEIDTRELMARVYPELLEMRPGLDDVEGQARYLDAFVEAIHRWSSGSYDDEYTLSFKDFVGGVTAALDDLVARLASADADAVVFTSGGPVSACAGTLLGDVGALWPRFATVVVNAAVTKVVAGRRGLQLLSFNEHAHLSEFTYV